MFKNMLILILIAILVALGAAAAIRVVFWSIGMFFKIVFDLALVVAAFIGVMYLLRKLRAG